MSTAKKYAAKCAIATASIFGPTLEASAQSEDQKWEAYAQSDYSFCDARKIAAVWETDAWGGKLVIGGKILAGIERFADKWIESTGQSVQCDWRELELEYSDAEKLAKFWGRSVAEAKTKAAAFATNVGARKFRREMAGVLR